MKNSIITLSFFVMCLSVLTANPASANPRPDSSYCLEISGKINLSAEENMPVTIELICMNKVIDSIFLKNSKKKFTLFLEKEKYYTIRIKMKDHLTKMIAVDTKNAVVPSDDDELLYFAFETSLDKSSAFINNDYRDFPIAVLYFDKQHKQFEYNKEYTANLKKELYLTAK